MIAISRTLRIALLISIGVHIVAMSAVTIITPDDLFRTQPYTKVDFLGSILKKSVFDIMMEEGPGVATPAMYDEGAGIQDDRHLEVSVRRRQTAAVELPKELEKSIDMEIISTFEEIKIVPDVTLGFEGGGFSSMGWMPDLENTAANWQRKVVYRPEAPFIMPGLYGYADEYHLKVKVLVSSEGRVLKVEPITTTGYPELDLTASEYVRGWIFDRGKDGVTDNEWLEFDVVLKASG